jgi:DNA helicase II / ATP-dependent DNA helicase PcrA
MQLNVLKITDSDIEYAQKILLKEGFTFDEIERTPFIKDLRTLDLQAVPGSGKTTVLLAKLLILERYLPFDNGSGILVASHTNAAVDEIKERIGKYCPKLFSYPNFIGTIQMFVDRYLATPYAQSYLNYKISWIDSDRYEETLWSKFKKIYWDSEYEKIGVFLWSRHITRAKSEAKAKGNPKLEKEICDKLVEETVKNIYLDFGDSKIKVKQLDSDSVLLTDEKNKKFIGLKKIITETLESGVLSYYYAYILSFNYLKSNNRIKKILQKRFSYVFVDEMQDMDKHQHDILEEIFWNNGDTSSIYQRIGDKNQAIFNGDAKIQEIWTERTVVLNLTQSHRLSSQIGNIVKNLTLSPIDVVGCKKNHDGSEIEIKPHIIVYTDASIKNCIEKFTTIIKSLEEEGKIISNKQNKYRAIAWNTTEPEDGKIKMNSYFNFSRDESKQKIDYSNLDTYLCVYDKSITSLKAIRTNIINAFLKVLRLEKLLDSENRNYTKRKLLKHLSENHPTNFEIFKLNIFKWSLDIVKGRKNEVLLLIRTYIVDFLSLFQKTITNSKTFIDTPYDNTAAVVHSSKKINTFSSNDIDVDVCTVHSVKGQTHTATLYLETFYKNGGGNYESQRLANQIKGNVFTRSNTEVINQTVKMLYVGFSRPTHLLCFAVHKSRFDSHLSNIDRDIWEVLEV